MTDDTANLDAKTICARCVHKMDASAPEYWKCDTNIAKRVVCYVIGETLTDFTYCELINTDGKCPDFKEVQGDDRENQ